MSGPRTFYATNQLLGVPPPTKEVPHTCQIVNYFNTQFTLSHFVALGPLTFPNLNILTIWVRGSLGTDSLWKEARGWGQEGWGKGGVVRGWGKGEQGGWNLYLNEIFNKTGIVTLILVIGMHIMRRNRPKLHFPGGFPNFWRESPL